MTAKGSVNSEKSPRLESSMDPKTFKDMHDIAVSWKTMGIL